MSMDIRTYRLTLPTAFLHELFGPSVFESSDPTCPALYTIATVDSDMAIDIDLELAKRGWQEVGIGDLRPGLTTFTRDYNDAATAFPNYSSMPQSDTYQAVTTNCASVDDLNALRAAQENLREHCEAQGRLINTLVNILQSHGLAG